MSSILNIHSIETLGTVDGPGIRVVVFLQGCNFHCLYCHNSDTIEVREAKKYSVDDLLFELRKYKRFMEVSGGGVTFSGGEPLLQSSALLELIEACNIEGIHTAIDTNGSIFTPDSKKVFETVDLILFDIKSPDPIMHKTLTGRELSPVLTVLDYIDTLHTEVWIRYVLVPGYTDSEKDIEEMCKILSTYTSIKKVEVLPYHTMGISKWLERGEPYQLSHVATPESTSVQSVQERFNRALQD